ncbi:MAG: class I SAM-dependent methyltransferase [Xanthomonadales bacterium]|nr:class I SAM-dependent methyltransferase [Xanthomonadales bacterium]
MNEVCPQYDRIAADYDRTRSRSLMERPYLERVAAAIPPGGTVLDLGCGVAEPIAAFFLDNGFRVTGVDGASAMIACCQARYPASKYSARWIHADMRDIKLAQRFHAIIAWDSFFHLQPADQRRMFPSFAAHLRPGGMLLFTSGHEPGEVTNPMHGEMFYHASLAPSEYRDRLDSNEFEVLHYCERDPDCGEHTVWLARFAPYRDHEN